MIFHPRPTRRSALARIVGATAAAALPAMNAFPARAGESVLIVIHANGARTADILDVPTASAALSRIAAEGVSYRACRAGGPTPETATRAILTGVPDFEGDASTLPTLCEYLRFDAEAPPHAAWVVAEGDGWPTRLGTSTNPGFGPTRAARILRPSTVLPAKLVAYGHARADGKVLGEADGAALRGLRDAVATPGVDDAPTAGVANALDHFIAGELQRKPLAGAGQSDARVLRAATSLLLRMRPRVVVAVLQETAVASESFERYQEVLRTTDAALGTLWDALSAQPETLAKTTLFVLPALGRNKRVNAGKLGQDDDSLSVKRSWLVAAGAGVRSGVVVKASVAAAGICASAARLLGVEAPLAKTRTMKELFGN